MAPQMINLVMDNNHSFAMPRFAARFGPRFGALHNSAAFHASFFAPLSSAAAVFHRTIVDRAKGGGVRVGPAIFPTGQLERHS